MASARMSLTLKPELASRLDSYAKFSLIPKVKIVSRALELYLSEVEEDARDYNDAVAAWKEFEASGEKGIPAEDLYKELGL